MRIAVDTKVLGRYLTHGTMKGRQSKRPTRSMGRLTLSSRRSSCANWYGCWSERIANAGPEIIEILRRLVAIRAVEIERPAAEAGIAMLARGGDFSDGVVRHEADRAKCDRLVTFDQSFARLLGPDKVALLGTRPTP